MTGPVTNELAMCPSNLVTAKKFTFEHLTLPAMNSETMNAISSCFITSVFAKETTGELSVYPVPANASGFELSVGPDLVTKSVGEPSICSVSLNDPDYELPICSVSVSQPALICLPVQFQSMSLILNCLSCQFLSLNCLPI